MIDSENLRTASLYINNQLLSRGLLRDGQNIDFADPGRAGLDATMGKVMSVVNDLILRRDRDAEARESLSATLRTLRASEQRQAIETTRQADALSRARHQLDTAEANARSLRERLAAAERSAARLREEEQRARALAAQARAACARDVKRRDRTIEDLKRAVVDAGRVRGQARGTLSCVTSVAVVGEVVGRNGVGGRGGSVGVGSGLPLGATEEEGYDLSLETNEFLTRLASGLSDENEGLRALVRRAVEGLREMSGLESGGVTAAGADALNGSASVNEHTATTTGTDEDPNAVVVVGTATTMKTAEELSADLDAVLDHLRTILTNPSFVPIEEVEIRDEEIRRLRAGFGRLEARWRDAVVLIDGWRRRMGGPQKGGGGGEGGGFGDELSDAALMLSPVRIRDEVRQLDMDSEMGVEGEEEGAAGVAVRSRLSCVREEDEEEEEGQGQEQEHEEEYTHVQGRNYVSMSRSRSRAQQQQQRQGRQEQKPNPEEVVRKSRSPSPVESLHLVPAPGYAPVEEEGEGDGEDDVGSDSSIFEDDIDMEALEAEEPNVQVLHESTWQERSADSSPLPEPPQLSPLKDSYASGNKGLSGHTSTLHRRGPGEFTTIVEENTWDLVADATTAGGIASGTAAAEDEDVEEEPPVPPPHTVDYKQRPQPQQGTPSTKENRAKASELLFSEEHTMYDSPLFGRSGEKPSMSDPTRKLFSKPPASRSATKEPSPVKLQEPEQQQPERRRTRQSERPKSSPADSPSAVTTRSTRSSAKRKSNPNPSSPSAEHQQPSRPSIQTTSTTSRSTASQDSITTKSNATSTTTVATNTASTSDTDDSATASQQQPQPQPQPASPSRNDSNGNSGSAVNAQQQTLGLGSRLPRRNNPLPPAQQSPLTMETIAAKLAAAEREADAARVRAKLRAARLGRRVGGGAEKRSSGNDARAKGGPASEPTVAATATTIQAPPPPSQQQQQSQKDREQEQQREQQAELAKRQQQERQPAAAVNQQRHNHHHHLEDVDPVKKSITSATTAVPSPRRYPQGNSSSNRKSQNHDNNDDEADELATSGGPGPSEIVIPKRKRDRKTSAVAAAASRRASRRRSTLSPWELESLIQGNVGSVESPAR